MNFKLNPRSFLCAAISMLFSCSTSGPCRFEKSAISEIILTYRKEIKRKVSDTKTIDIFSSHLNDAESIKTPESPLWDYSFKINSKDCSGGIWLYSSSTGNLSRLNYRLKPSFRLRNYVKFNSYLTELYSNNNLSEAF